MPNTTHNPSAAIKALHVHVSATAKAEHKTYGGPHGYPERHLYTQPDGTPVVVVQDGKHNPDARTESHMFAEALFKSAKFLLEQKITKLPKNNHAAKLEIEEKIEALRLRVADFHVELDRPEHWYGGLAGTQGNIAEPPNSPANKNFKKNVAVANDFNQELMDDICNISSLSRSKLQKAGHQLRSQQRETIFHTWKVGNQTYFRMFEPAGRYTPEQWRVKQQRGELSPQQLAQSQPLPAAPPSDHLDHKHSPTSASAPISVNRHHATTSHQKSKWEGTSNFVRMTVGTLDEKGNVTILRQGVGRGALTTYKDYRYFERPEQKLEILATARRNQLEVLTELAKNKLNKLNPSPSDQKTPLDVREVYMQVVTPGATLDELRGEYQNRQFRDTHRIFELMNSQEHTVHIQTDDKTEATVRIRPRSSVFCFGINDERDLITTKQEQQNRRAINELIDNDFKTDFDNTITSLLTSRDEKGEAIIHSELHTHITELQTAYSAVINGSKNNKELFSKAKSEISALSVTLQKAHQKLNQLLTDFENAPKEKRGAAAKAYTAKEKEIEALETQLFAQHQQLEILRRQEWQRQRPNIVASLNAIGGYNEKANPIPVATVQQIQRLYNISAMLCDSLDMYYNDDWKANKDKNKPRNCALQSTLINLADSLGAGTNGGCKSFNDRGMELMSNVDTNVVLQATNNGWYPGLATFHDARWNAQAHHITAVTPVIHHAQNEAIGGGKYKGQNSACETVNSLWGNIAPWAKLKKLWAEIKNEVKAGLDWVCSLVRLGETVADDYLDRAQEEIQKREKHQAGAGSSLGATQALAHGDAKQVIIGLDHAAHSAQNLNPNMDHKHTVKPAATQQQEESSTVSPAASPVIAALTTNPPSPARTESSDSSAASSALPSPTSHR